MGTRIPEPIPTPPAPPGDDCGVCWGPGGVFGDFPTPSEVTIEVTGVEKGPNWVGVDGDPPNGVFVCPQFGPAFPCSFITPGPPGIGVLFTAPGTTVFGQVGSGATWFQGTNLIPCVTVVQSDLDDHFVNGTAVITIPGVE